MKFIVCILFLAGLPVFAQQQDSLQVLLTSDWRTKDWWFGSDTVQLIPVAKMDTAGLPEKEKEIFLYRNNYGERICVRPGGGVVYSKWVKCPVGETRYDVKSIVFASPTLTVMHQKYRWGEAKPADYNTSVYRIIVWNSQSIVLVKNE